MRINGFSGMDIDSMVSSMMKARRVPLDKLNQQKQILEWQRDNYREMNSKLFAFSNSKLKNYGLSSAMNSNKATVSGNTTAVKAEATASANNVPMEVRVDKLATQGSVVTTGAGYGLKLNMTLEDANRVTDPVAVIPDTYKLHINGVDFSFDKKMSISEVMTQINGDPDAKATAKFDELTGKLSIVSKDYGNNAKLEINDATLSKVNTLFDIFKGVATHTANGSNADVNINGVDLEFSSNTFTINGVQMTLLSETGTEGPSKITTTTDTTKPLETIKAFINDYNELIGALNSKVNEERYKNFAPLSTEQKSEMKENDIKNWEEKAKSGMLKNDQILKSAINNMRLEITDKLDQLSAIGITTGQYHEGGKLYLDETKLKAALETDPQSIMDLFRGPDSATSEGIFDKLQEVMDDTMTNLADKAGTSKFDGSLTGPYKTESSMGKQLKDYNKRIDDLQDRLVDIENRYYKQFTAMETAMNKYNAQSSNLMNSLGMS